MSRQDFYHQPDMPQATRLVPAVSAIVQDHRGYVVLQKRSDNGYWSLPGGGVEPGETVAQAMTREIFEETGFHASIQRLVGIYSDPLHVIAYTDGEVRQQFSICFACTILRGAKIISDESIDVELFSIQKIDALHIHPANKIRIDDFLANAPDPFLR